MPIDFQLSRTSSSQTGNVPMSPCKNAWLPFATLGLCCDFGSFFCRESCTIFEPQIPKPQISNALQPYSDRNRLNPTLSEAMPGWPGWRAARHNGGVCCPSLQERREACFQSAIESAALIYSAKYRACMFWRALQSLAIAHSCCGAEPWLSTAQAICRYNIEILMLAVRTT